MTTVGVPKALNSFHSGSLQYSTVITVFEIKKTRIHCHVTACVKPTAYMHFCHYLRLYSTRTAHAGSKSSRLTPDKNFLTLEQRKEREEAFRRRKTEWKRRQGVRRHNLVSTDPTFTPDS